MCVKDYFIKLSGRRMGEDIMIGFYLIITVEEISTPSWLLCNY
jgi:hypothetical protein